MITLNLANSEQSDIKFEVSKFPDGQRTLDITSHVTELGFTKHAKDTFWIPAPVQISSRFNNFEDLNLIITANQALKRLGVKEVHLYIPYLLSARADRLFKEGGTSYLVDVVAPILNTQEFESITCMDVHSDVAAACIKNLKESSIGRFGLTKWALSKIYPGYKGTTDTLKDLVLISPDAGALKKTYKLADQLGYRDEVVVCSKHRDAEGKLTKTVVPMQAYQDKDYIIVDDICDGGRTFINIAKEIKPYMGKKATINLIVTHGIFSAGFSELDKYFDGIYYTNSYKDKEELDVNFGDSSSIRQSKFIETKLKQLNVF